MFQWWRSATDVNAGEAQLIYNRRVRVAVQILDHPEERRLAVEELTAQGWAVREAEAADRIPAEARHVAYVVEVRVRGARLGARAGAVRAVEGLAKERKLPLWIRDSALVVPVPPPRRTTYHVRRRGPAGAGRVVRWLYELAAAVGLADVQRALSLPGAPDEAAAVRELTDRDLGGRPFDPAAHTLRRSLGPAVDDAAAPDADGTRELVTRGAAGGAVTAAFLVCGALIADLDGWWRLVPALLVAASCWPVGRWLTSNEPRPFVFRLGIGVALVGGTALVGWMWGADNEDSLATQALRVGVAVLLLLVLAGVWLALSHSWFSRNAQWVVPLLATPLVLVLPMFGGLLHSVYLTEEFGIPSAAVPVEFYAPVWMALRPVGVAAASVLLFIAMGGWARHLHMVSTLREMLFVSIPLLCVVYVLTALLVGMDGASTAAARTAGAAREGQDPARYYGFDGRLLCVRPLTAPDAAPVLGGPLPPADRPMLFFGAEGEHVWLWDPVREEPLRIRQEDVSLADCPADT
ncbi:hypothetical protein [Streptomyces sp. URMC 129]|uniref:hypothetical protein n=1 Tax=Streptomyces sp. URMC 129 TaxID=3423407 RepID=UPI003F196AE4